MESNEFVNLYIDKIFAELNEANKEKIIFKTNTEAANLELERLRKVLEELQTIQAENNNTIENLTRENATYVEDIKVRQATIEGLSAKLRDALQTPLCADEKVQLLTEIATLNEKVRNLIKSNEFLSESLKGKDSKIATLSAASVAKPVAVKKKRA